MGRHVNHYDVQDRMIARNKVISNTKHSASLDERDPASLSIVEQEELIKARIKAKIQKEAPVSKPPVIRFTGKKIK